jgi:hypothetical protein
MNEKEVATKPQVSKENLIESGYEGITIVKDENFIPRSELTKEDIKKFPLVLVQLVTKFINKSNNQRDSISLRVYPFEDKKDKTQLIYNGFKVNKFSDLIRLNDDNSVRLTRNELVNIFLSINKSPEITDSLIQLPRYARLITGINPADGTRHYRLQLFISFDCVKSIFFNRITLETISKLIKNKYIAPVVFTEATSDDLDFENQNQELI